LRVNTALIALPRSGKQITPPLTLAYMATLLEQRRHIVRIYDSALTPEQPLRSAFQQLRGFRPQVVVVAGDSAEGLSLAEEAFHQEDQRCMFLPIQLRADDLDAGWVCSSVAKWFERHNAGRSGRSDTLLPITGGTLDQLPFPARHLLSLEGYNMRAVGGELQTTLLVGGSASASDGRMVLRAPAQIIAELRSVSHEFGLRHYLFPGIPLTTDRSWLYELLTRLVDAKLNVHWEATVEPELLDEALIAHMGRAGCEMVHFNLDGARVFDTSAARDELRHVVSYFRQHTIYTRAEVKLEPVYESIARLVDVAATFGLDDVSFSAIDQHAAGSDLSDLEGLARKRYDEGRDRQKYINRFGATLGNLIWRLRGPRQTSPFGNLPEDQERAV
jgi:hypothetical protein